MISIIDTCVLASWLIFNLFAKSPFYKTRNLFDTDRLTIDDLREVCNAVWAARNKWYDIGIQLGLKATDLDEIEENYPRNIGKCFSKMLMLWLRGVNPPPTWSAMVDALKIPAVGLGDLAEEVESKFLHQASATDSGKTTGEIISYNRNAWR